jgi:2'-5' RNA ligase
MPDLIRTFIAIELDDAIQRALGDLQARLKRERAAQFVRWVAPENIHLTLKFLGDVDATQMPALERAVMDAGVGFAPFTLTLHALGAFPNLRKPNVVWIGLQGEIESAARLAEKIDAACAELGYAREARPFAPHLTLGRVKKDARGDESRMVGEMIANAKIELELGVRVESVSVMRSELKPTGSVYSRLAIAQLANEPMTNAK